MYNFILTKTFLSNQKSYISDLNQKELENFLKLKELFINDIFDKKLKTHSISDYKNIKVFSSYINKKDRIIFFYKDPNKIYLYKIMEDHDYKKLLSNINFALKDFFDNF
jgi:hypothetical protein